MHLTETCEPDMPHLITNVETTDATADDVEMTPAIHQRLGNRRLAPGEHVADADYVSAGHILAARYRPRDHAARAGRRRHPPHPARRHRAGTGPGPGRLPRRLGRTQGHLPPGAVSLSWSDQRKPSGTPIARVHFALADCNPCPLRSQCTKAANGKWGRSLTLLPREQHEILAQQRAEQQTAEWKARYDIRAGIEGTISQAVRRTRLRRTPTAAGQDPSRERAVRHRPQPHPRRRLAERHPARHNPRLSP